MAGDRSWDGVLECERKEREKGDINVRVLSGRKHHELDLHPSKSSFQKLPLLSIEICTISPFPRPKKLKFVAEWQPPGACSLDTDWRIEALWLGVDLKKVFQKSLRN